MPAISPPRAAVACAALALLSACTPAPQNIRAGTVAVETVRPRAYMGRWRSGESFTVIYAVTEISGRAAVCGAWSYFGNATSTHYPQLLSSMRVDMGDDRLVSNLSYFTATGVAEPGTVDTPTLSCALSELPWQPGYATQRPEISASQHSFNG
ncbi:hypothetical protein FDP22_11055 [Paroceanicella profunda]|uniref:Uncharacterized protein n=1 Tax=Paroceanicella profunda TaxID=2579971 RepID=A0A5B8FHR3_9RHOB|nr:hypothetical protein [Paroceanicella profunda]QDL92268.1 hypothetical protein FDP22_11055 [Paroceanicella profunda]